MDEVKSTGAVAINFTALNRNTGYTGNGGPEEPVFDIADIQGNIIPGFNKNHQYIIGLKIGEVPACKHFLKEIIPHISTLDEVMAFRKIFRMLKLKLGRKPHHELKSTWMNIAFSYTGISKLTDDCAFNSEAFKVGLAARASFLGDPTSNDNEGSPQNWIIGNPGNEPEVLMIFGGDVQEDLQKKVGAVREMAIKAGMEFLYEEEMGGIERDGVSGTEHFGFKDGISQPGVRGRLSDSPTDFLQTRTIAPDVLPDSLLYGYPGQFLSWPGEFVFGYPGQTLDPLVAGSKSTEKPSWTNNGSFLVFRRYKQNVPLFWNYIKETATELAGKTGFDGMTPDKLAAMLVGRWPSGAPFARVQDQDNKALGSDQMANNYFRYASDSCPVKMTSGKEDSYPQAKADPIGLTCPLTSHIRKVNTRDSSNDAGGTLASFNQRLLRRGLSFGPPLADPLNPNEPDPVKGNRGLLFLSYQTSIENQFEFLNNRWMSNKFAPKSPGGDDLFVGQNGNAGEERERTGGIFGKNAVNQQLKTSDQWITSTGGGYFFSPSLSAIAKILSETN